MFPLLARLFRRHPSGFPLRIEARFDQTLVYEGAMRTGADLFGTGGQPLPPLVYQRFTFERGGRAYSFMVRDNARAMRLAPGECRRAISTRRAPGSGSGMRNAGPSRWRSPAPTRTRRHEARARRPL
jgi:hypothetical protein